MVIIHRLILTFRFTPLFWWWRLITHQRFKLDDYHAYEEFWNSINSGFLDMNYKWKFEEFWGKGSYPPERIVLSKENFDALVERLNEPPQYNENIARVLSRKAPWEN